MSTGKRKHATPPSRRQLPASQSRFVECPCCPALVPIALINEHLDEHQRETGLHSEASTATTPAPAVVNTPTPKGVGAAAARVTVAGHTPASAAAPPSLSLQSTASSSSHASSARLPLQPSPATAALSQTPLGRAFAASSSAGAPSRDTASPPLGLSPVGPPPPPVLAPHSCFLPAYVNRLGDHVYPGAGRNELGPALHDTRRVNAWLVRSAWLQQRAAPVGGDTLGRVLELAGEIGQAGGSGEGALLDAAERELVAAAATVGPVARELLGHAFEASGGWCRLHALPPPEEVHAEAHAEGASQEGGGGGGGGGDGGGPPAPGSASLPVAGAAGAAGACGAATGREGEGARSGSSYGVEGGDELLSDLGASPMPEMATSPGGTGVVTSARKREFHRGAAPGSSTRGFKVPQQSSDSPWGAHPQAQLPAQDPATPPRDAGASLLPRPSALRAEGDAPPPAGEDAVPSQGSRGGAMAQRRLWGKSPSEVPVGGEGGSAPKAMGGPGRAFAPPAPGSPLLALLSSNELPGALQAARTTASAANAPGSAAGAARPQDEEVERVLRSLRTSQMALVKHVGSLGDALMAVHATQVAAAESAPEALGPWHAGPGWLAGAAVVALNAALAGALLLHARAGP